MALIIREAINIHDDRLTSGLIPVFRIMEQVANSDEELIEMDCSSIRFCTPVFVMSTLLFLRTSQRQYSLSNLTDYLRTVKFDNALRPDDIGLNQFEQVLEQYGKKTYIPLISFPAQTGFENSKDAVISALEDLMCHQVNIPHNISMGLKYMLSEMVDNITGHSESERGYIFAQAYPKKRYLDICIADEGITLKGSYQRANIEIEDDLEAMRAANKCVSSKNLPDAENRGYGIMTTKKMLSDGLNGQYMMLSGSAILLKSRNLEQIIELPEGVRWDGTIIAIRIPYHEQNEFYYCNYLE